MHPYVIYLLRMHHRSPAQAAHGDFLPLSPAIHHILLALADEERHGYAIMLEVTRLTGGATKMGPGTLYGTLKRMLTAGLIEEAAERPDPGLDDERRRYYRITPLGAKVLRAETSRVSLLVNAARAKKVRA
jgi:DNA-binding PadR family transcriptional regulator